MSRHQAYRNYDYENDLDEFDGEHADDEDELSPEDQVLMREGTEEVKNALGLEAGKVTVAQIQEALWHYYYDVDKTVAYLLNKFIAPAPKQPKSKAHKEPDDPTRELATSDPADAPARSFGSLLTPWKGGHLRFPSLEPTRVSFAHFFSDMPWLNIPEERRTTFIEPPRPRGGLLGGSGAPPKMSKLQALAAARKKRAEERKSESREQETREQLQNLSVSDPSPKPESLAKRRKITGTSSSSSSSSSSSNTSTGSEELREPSLVPTPIQEPLTNGSHEDDKLFEAPVAQPSAFARTLFGSASARPHQPPMQHFPLPYVASAPPSYIQDAFSRPSPDDVVLAAQAKAGKPKPPNAPPKKKGGHDGQADAAANGVKALKIDDTPLPKSKNLNVLNEYGRSKKKKSASFVVVGHVDAGKSTLMGRLLLDLNVVDQRTVDKYRKEAETMGKSSFALAWVLDQGTEERSRGVTIDIATNRFETDTTSFTVLDAPGHRDFIPNMIAGASQADFAILVIDASTGAFESGLKGQTREHSLLIRSMGVSRIIVAVNKLDTVGWSKDRFDEITQQVSGFLSATGFQMKNISFVPVSGLNGDNLVNRSTEAAASWYTGPTLIEELENSEPMARALNKPLRMTISEVYRTAVSPVTISGRIDAGSLQAGDALLVQPSGEKAYVKSLELDAEPVDWAVAGQNVVMYLTNIDPVHVRVGDIICDPAKPIECIDTFTMKALAFDILLPMQVDVHRGRLHAAGHIHEIAALLHKTTGAVIKKKPKLVKPGSVARIIVRMDAKVPLEPGQRVVLRSGGETIAAGLLE